MSDLLIHSMAEFRHLILEVLAIAGARNLVEVGAEHGGMSNLLADYAAAQGGTLTSIDPAPSDAFLHWLPGARAVRHLAQPSLEVLSTLENIDAWLLDGDHNWYSVYHELHALREVCRNDNRPLLVFAHDVGWPCARRDQYYAPERIPSAFLHPHRFDAGTTLDSSELVPQRGFRGCGAFALAAQEGGPRNGVLTAIEDFARDCHELSEPLGWATIPAVFGLAVLFDLHAPWAGKVADLLAPYNNDPLLARLEENRLRNYLAVIDWQDRQSPSAQVSVGSSPASGTQAPSR